ncbi:hypothetical protein BJ170DRAFT_728223 [Xylariales sp. AK1849]|nr:hypothetical protein BJ170DRAFT_728223 [Xylariales sp. AK1849]
MTIQLTQAPFPSVEPKKQALALSMLGYPRKSLTKSYTGIGTAVSSERQQTPITTSKKYAGTTRITSRSFPLSNLPFASAPAFQIIQLDKSNSIQDQDEINVLLAAAGDLSTLIKTIVKILKDTTTCAKFHFRVNDQNINVVARNLVIIVTAIMSDNMMTSAEAIVHYWYISFLPDWVFCLFLNTIARLSTRFTVEDLDEPALDDDEILALGAPWGTKLQSGLISACRERTSSGC